MAEETKNCCCSQRRKVRERTEEEALLQRLSRIEGQVRMCRASSSRLKAFSADWMAETWVRISVQ